ncbi:hypothetical protein U1Q18_006335 [Sarracenia purpurea var. burkii]
MCRSLFKRSLSDGNILCESNSPIEATDVGLNEDHNHPLLDMTQNGNNGLSESTPEISTCESELHIPRRVFPHMQLNRCLENGRVCFDEHLDSFNFSNFFDMDRLSSSGNSCGKDIYERSTLISSPIASISLDSVDTGLQMESGGSANDSGSSMKNSDILAEFSDSFVHWITYGEMLSH